MIGQLSIQKRLSKYSELPKFMIFEGLKGCGKKTLAKELSKKYNLNYVSIGLKIDDISSMIEIANNTTNNLFFIDKGNELSSNSENALLKITEELPNNNYIVLSCENSVLLLPTVISRGELFRFEDYKENDFKEYLGEKYLETITYSLVYPNLGSLNDIHLSDANEIIKICNNLTTFNSDERFILQMVKMANNFNLNQFLYCLEKTSYDKMLTSIKDNDKIIMRKLIGVIESVSRVRQLLAESLVYNRNYIMDFLGLRIIEVSK